MLFVMFALLIYSQSSQTEEGTVVFLKRLCIYMYVNILHYNETHCFSVGFSICDTCTYSYDQIRVDTCGHLDIYVFIYIINKSLFTLFSITID